MKKSFKETEADFQALPYVMPPAWLVFPEHQRGSMFWRMGAGEWYIQDLIDWKDTLTPEQMKIYERMFPQPKADILSSEAPEYFKGTKYHHVCCWRQNGRPAYSLPDLQQDCRRGKQLGYVLFWRPEPIWAAPGPPVLSQWWLSDFNLNHHDYYCCAEQYMMAEKSRLFGDEATLDEIMECRDPKKLKKLGRRVSGFQEDVWVKCRYSIVLNGSYQKFMQNEELCRYLLSTGDQILVEASPFDTIWGIGMQADDPNAQNPLKWKGENLLGFALMEVREEIRGICQYANRADWDLIREKYRPKGRPKRSQ